MGVWGRGAGFMKILLAYERGGLAKKNKGDKRLGGRVGSRRKKGDARKK